jgi:hypothetical protein
VSRGIISGFDPSDRRIPRLSLPILRLNVFESHLRVAILRLERDYLRLDKSIRPLDRTFSRLVKGILRLTCVALRLNGLWLESIASYRG